LALGLLGYDLILLDIVFGWLVVMHALLSAVNVTLPFHTRRLSVGLQRQFAVIL